MSAPQAKFFCPFCAQSEIPYYFSMIWNDFPIFVSNISGNVYKDFAHPKNVYKKITLSGEIVFLISKHKSQIYFIGCFEMNVRAHTERYEFGSSLPVTASRFEIGSVTQSSVKTAPQADIFGEFGSNLAEF